MDEAQAILHFKNACVPAPGTDDAALRAQWLAARAKIGAPVPNAGLPVINPLPASHAAYAASVVALPWVANGIPGVQATDVRIVEIDPILAFQFTVDLGRSDHHCAALASPPTLDQLLAVCLPQTQPIENFNFQVLPQSAIIKTRSLNLRLLQAGIIQNMAAGFTFGPALPLVQVVRFNGRYFLYNGYHRAIGIRRAGATMMPCIVRDAPNAAAAGILGAPHTFSEALLTSANPPTVAHFAQGRAYDVQIRATSRILHVSWSDYVWAEE